MTTLLTIPFSHFCEKARWSLDHARVVYSEQAHAPFLHRLAVRRARGAPGSVPVLVAGREVIDDSPLIVRWADAHAPPDRKLLPRGGRELDEALALERHLDLDFAPHVRRLAYFHMLPDRTGALGLMSRGTPAHERHMVALAFPVLRVLLRRIMRIDAKGAERSRSKVRAVFDEISERLSDGRPYLMGDRFGAPDLAFAAFSAGLVVPPEHPVYGSTPTAWPPGMKKEAEGLVGTPAAEFVLRMYREHRREKDE
jgi:glutathione S-transferase